MKTQLKEDELNWTDKLVIGMVLMGAERDSFGGNINPMQFYKVGKHKISGKLAIVPTDKNMRRDFINESLGVKENLN